jgi:hypothetical protein
MTWDFFAPQDGIWEEHHGRRDVVLAFCDGRPLHEYTDDTPVRWP